MKRQRRHELHTNYLAQWLAGVVTVVKPYINAILAVLLVVVLVGGAAAWWMRHSASGTGQAWDAFNRAMEGGKPSDFDTVAEKNPGTEAARWADLVAGDIYLQQGCEQILRDKATSNQLLQKALDHYLRVLDTSQQSRLRQQATFGAARAYEALSGTRRAENEMQQAIDQYEKLIQTWPDSAYVPLAKRRLEELRSPQAKAFYDKLAQYEPKSAFVDGPGSSAKPPISADVPEEPAEKIKIRKPGGPAPKPAQSGEGQTPSKPLAGDKESKPGSAKQPTKPAAPPETPAAEKPATPPPAKDKPAESAPGKEKN